MHVYRANNGQKIMCSDYIFDNSCKADMNTAVCIMIDRSEKIVECNFPSPLTGFDGFE